MKLINRGLVILVIELEHHYNIYLQSSDFFSNRSFSASHAALYSAAESKFLKEWRLCSFEIMKQWQYKQVEILK